MTMLAKRLRLGDRIGVVSPSSPVAPDLESYFKNGVAFLKRMGFEVAIGRNVHSMALGYAASPQEKADDINQMYADASIKAIICTQGGSTANSCLSFLDWRIIKNNPKVFIGLSDISVLLNAIYKNTGVITFHGNDLLWGLGKNPVQYDEQEFKLRLIDGKIGLVQQNGERRTIRPGIAQGKLLGGNLSCLLKLAGTPFFPNFKGALLFLEAYRDNSEECDFRIFQLKHMGVFKQVSGVLIGHVDELEKDKAAAQMEDILMRITLEQNFPILKVGDFGHNCPNTVLPVGGNVRIDADAQTIEILSPCVE
jgi:muramoyltetrapeptide carboxypeptidase